MTALLDEYASYIRRELPWIEEDGILRLQGGHTDEVTQYYEFTGGPHFVDTTFASNPLIHCATRKYRQYLDEWFPSPRGALLDLGCGDGRLTLWALERGFAPVFAFDTSLAALRRLQRTARERGLRGLVPVCATFQDDCLVPRAFDVVLFWEALCYMEGHGGLKLGFDLLKKLVKPGGRAGLCELTRHGRLLSDVQAMNVENMRKTAYEGQRWEKMADRKIACAHTTPAELEAECEANGFRVVDRRGLSPIPMLFHFAYNFTSYPLRPELNAELQRLLETLDDQTSELGQLSRNTVLLLEPKGA